LSFAPKSVDTGVRTDWEKASDEAPTMFKHQGPGRSDRQNRALAGYLAFMGGFVNSAGFVLIGSFTSHVTGNVGRFANDLAMHQGDAALTAMTMVLAFFAGAFFASMAIESNFFGRPSNAYGVALSGEALLLVVFALASNATVTAHARQRDLEAAILCVAMGMQNSLVTRLSGAVVRTTHLTGVMTDLGIEGARWFRFWRGSLADALGVKLSFGQNPPDAPSKLKISLLLTIASAFTLGAVFGATAAVTLRHAAMLLPSVGVGAAAAYAFANGRKSGDSIPPVPHSRR
jgi:uncharacterized membrane protein YoaK (UPF0700 family)